MILQAISIDNEFEGEHLSKVAWDLSRGSTESKLDDILKVNAPVNEMPSGLFLVHCTIVEREVITSIVEHSMWSRSSRVDDILDFKITPHLQGLDRAWNYAADCRNLMRLMKESGSLQDAYRLQLPLTSMTSFVVRLNMRAVGILSEYFNHLRQISPPSESAIYTDATAKFAIARKQMGGDHSFPFAELLGDQIVLPKSKATRVGQYVHVSLKAPFSLRTHLTRHRTVTMLDNLKQWVMDGISQRSIGDTMPIEVVATIPSWNRLYKTRSCFIAQADLWDPLLNMAMSVIPTAPTELLPCANGVCPVAKDVQLRMEGKDPGAVCPRYVELNGLKLNKEQVALINRDIRETGRSEFWRNYLVK